MTPQQRKEVARYLEAFDFSGLFADPSIGWSWPDSGRPLVVPFGDDFIALEHVAQKKGVRILLVPPLKDGSIMPSDDRKKLEKAVTPLAAEHLLIFGNKAKTRQIWLWTSRVPGKPVRHRELTWEKGRANELLLQKLTSIAFTLDEEEGLDITGVVQRLRDNLDRDKLTKKFYNEFKSQKDQFQKFIKGIGDSGILAHYTSLMLNRLMFCYFLQQKGFLNGEQDYLRKRLDTVRDSLGKDHFHSFYRTFLKRLFFDGLDGEDRPAELVALIGKKIPYLNGGIFAEHPIERGHPDITIPDAAFEKIFDFFDAYHWHLDDRPLGNDREINPEVLGYVFEKYTNQKEMGAYYTKEDITEYISKKTILPFLLQKVAAKIPAEAWELLKNDPDRYIYEAVRRGAGADEKAWKKSLPANIAVGLDTKAPDLIERRKNWNTSTPGSHALPTEIWRETIARHQRCHELRKKLRAGEVTDPADLVTLNLDIRQFVSDLIAAAPADLALALWKALRSLSVLDPTCGSGAFLFAALEILEPLYEGLLERFRALLADWQATGEKHRNWEKEFGAILDSVERHPNEGYFIHKTLIVHNLYGVDIMEEAVEICKLRLFLKLAAQLEPGQDIEPLPDIDFNVRAGNTLVGYASREEIKKAFTEAGGSGQALLQGIETSLDDYNRIMEQAEDADRAFRRFQDLQDTVGQSPTEFRTAKETLESRLQALRAQLDRFLAGQYDQKNLKTAAALQQWKVSHEPFHWFVEFYGIMNSGGFDVIVGNPPWKEYSAAKKYYTVRGYATERSGNLYTLCTERCVELLSVNSMLSFIVQLPIVCSLRMSSIRTFLSRHASLITTLTCDDRPGKLFEGLQNCRSTIFLLRRGTGAGTPKLLTSGYRRWATSVRDTLFETTELSPIDNDEIWQGQFPKLASSHQVAVFAKVFKPANPALASTTADRPTQDYVFYQESARYWVKATVGLPHYAKNGHVGAPAHGRHIYFDDARTTSIACAVLHSSLFYTYFIAYGDCFHVNDSLATGFCIPPAAIKDKRVEKLGRKLMKDLKANADEKTINTKDGNRISYDEFRIGCSKPLIDQIDTLLAEHYGFTEEELDFIINYNIKYRMGLSGGSADIDEES